MWRRLRIGGIVIVAAIAVAGCDALKDVMTVSTALDERFHEPMNVNFNNGSHLVITLVNAPESELDSAGREDYARQVATFAKSRWPHPRQLDDITVAYTSVSKKSVVTFTNTTGSYRWRVDELPALAPGDSAAPRAEPPLPGNATQD